jgi:hypothetical protein
VLLAAAITTAMTGGPGGPVDRQAWFQEPLDAPRTSARRLAAKAALRTSVPEAAHTLWALTVPELYILNVTESGRRPDAYQRWLADVLVAALLAP